MSSLAISGIVFACVFSGTVLGMLLRYRLPEHHLSAESKETLKVGMGLIGTMGALVLGLMVSAAKSSYDTQKSDLAKMSAKIMLLDRMLARYGPETKKLREMLRGMVTRLLDLIWPTSGSQPAQLDPSTLGGEALFDRLQDLTPKNEAQRVLKAQALSTAIDIGNIRWLIFEQSGSSISTLFLVVLVFWFTVIFLGFGLMAPNNSTVLATLLLCAVSVAAALFLILELDRPFDGMIQISSEPLRKVAASLGQ